MTLSFLTYVPNLSVWADRAHAAGHEVLAHLPMEPLENVASAGPRCLRVSMTADEVRSSVATDLDSWSGYRGVNNHMGSRFCQDRRLMNVVMEELKARDLLWLDSRTTAATSGPAAAAAANVPCLERDVFLDYEDKEEIVLAQLRELARIGSRISHFYFDVSVRRRLTPNPPPPVHTWKERLARVWQKTPRFEEAITTQHQLEAAGAAAFRRGVLEAAGGFDESLQRAEDTDMTMRLRAMGIDIYYYPFQEIRHQYSPFMDDTLTKCFLTGYNRYRLYQKHGNLPGLAGPVKTLISHEVQAVMGAVWRARQAESIPKLVLYLPFMLMFEAATGLGFLAGFASQLLVARPVAPPPRRS